MSVPAVVPYCCEVDAAPFALRIATGDGVLMETGTRPAGPLAGPGAFCRDGVWHTVTGVLAEERDCDGIHLRCATTDPEVELLFTLTYREDGVHVSWHTADGLPCAWLGDAFQLAPAGDWTRGPHDALWVTARGAALLVLSEAPAVWLNEDGDGLLRVAQADTAEFSYLLLIGDDATALSRHVVRAAAEVAPPGWFSTMVGGGAAGDSSPTR